MSKRMADAMGSPTKRLRVNGDFKTIAYATPLKLSTELQDLPTEILCMLLKLTVVDNVPIVDPRGENTCRFCSIKTHGQISKTKTLHQRRSWNFRDDQAQEVLRDARNLDSSEIVLRDGMNPNILLASKFFNEIGSKYLYKSNKFLFTNVQAMDCFVRRFPSSYDRIRHVGLFIKMSQWSAKSVCHITRTEKVQELPDGPWYSRAERPVNWWSERGHTVECPFTSLESLDVRILNWQRFEAVNVNGMPYRRGFVYAGDYGEPCTDNPRREDIDIRVRASEPTCMVQKSGVRDELFEMILCRWTAANFRVTGCEEALEYGDLQEEVSGLNDEIRRMGEGDGSERSVRCDECNRRHGQQKQGGGKGACPEE